MNDEELKNRIESSSGLRRVRETLCDEVSFRAAGSARLDPITILMIISVVVQVIRLCIERNNPQDDIVYAIRNARTLPRRRLILLRRRLNRLSADNPERSIVVPPVYDSLVSMAEELTDEEIAELMQLAEERDS